jgi:hypothetical protein
MREVIAQGAQNTTRLTNAMKGLFARCWYTAAEYQSNSINSEAVGFNEQFWASHRCEGNMTLLNELA